MASAPGIDVAASPCVMLALLPLLATAGALAAPAADIDPWERAQALVAKMTLDEKMQLIQGNKQAVDPEGPDGGCACPGSPCSCCLPPRAAVPRSAFHL